MFHRLKTLLTHTVTYGLGDVATSLASLLLLPIFTRYLSPVDFGIIALLLSVEAVTKVLFRWGIDSAFLRLSYDCADDRARQRLASSIFFFLLTIDSGLLLIGLAAAPTIVVVLFDAPDYTGTLRLVLLNTFVISLFFIPFTIMRIEQRSRRFAVVTFSRSVLTLVTRLVLVVVAGMGVRGVVLADVFVTIVYTVILSQWTIPFIRLTMSWSVLREAVRFGLPKLPHGIAHQAITVSDRYLLRTLATVHDVGVYTIGATLGLGLKYFLSAFQTAWSPFLFEMMNRPDARNTYRAVTTYVFLVLVMAAAGLSAVAGDLLALLTTPEFHGAAQVVPWIVIGALLQGVYQLTSVGLSITKRTEYYPIATGIAAVVSVSANLVLIPRFGIMGAAWANMLAYGALAASGMAFSQRYYPITYEWSRLVRLALAGVVAYMLAAAVPSATTPLPGLLIRGMVVVVCYPVLLFGLGFFRPSELRRICDSMTLRRAPAATAPPPLLEHREEERQMNIP